MNQTMLPLGYPKNPFSHGTQKWRVFEILKNRGEAAMPDFLKTFPSIPEFRSRINEIEKVIRADGWTIRRRREPGSKYVFFSIAKI